MLANLISQEEEGKEEEIEGIQRSRRALVELTRAISARKKIKPARPRMQVDIENKG